MSLFARLAEHAARRPQRTALAWPGGELDYARLLTEVEAAVERLGELSGQVVALDAGNGPGWVVLDIAAARLGICLVPLPPFFSTGQLRHVLRRSAAAQLITDSPGPARRRIGDLLADREVPIEIGRQGFTLIATAAHAGGAMRSVPAGVDKITFTSGTTGAPKGVMLAWSQIRPVVESLADAVSMTADDRHLALMPLAVLLENIGGVYAPLWAGASVRLLPMDQVGLSGSSGLDGRAMAQALGRHRASTAIFTPQTLQGVVEAMEGDGGLQLSLRFAAVGGAPVSPRLLERAGALGLPVFEGYGLSECASVVCLNTPAQHRPGSVGRPLPHVHLEIAADGEVLVGGPRFIGYLGEEALPQGHWPSGDLGELDADGFLYLRGRRRNVFITAFGRNVAPEWVERELTLEPAIAQAAVFGEARACNVAVLVPAAGARPADIETAVLRANRSLPDYARVTRWLAAPEPFSPVNGLLTGTGRVRRDAVLDRYGEAMESLYREAQTS